MRVCVWVGVWVGWTLCGVAFVRGAAHSHLLAYVRTEHNGGVMKSEEK